MNRPFRTVLLSSTLVAGLGLAQDTSQTQTTQTQPGQTQGMQMMGDQHMLGELCEVYQGLGQLIIRLEGQGMSGGMGTMPTGTMTTETSTPGTATPGTAMTGTATTGTTGTSEPSTTGSSTSGTPAGEPVGATDASTWSQEQRDALTRARTELEGLRSTIEADELDDATRQDLTRIREGLRTDLGGASEQDRATAEGLEALFEQLEQQASEGQTEQYRATYGSILGLLDASAGTDQMSGQTMGQTTGQQPGQAGMGQQAQGMMRSAEDICRELGTQGMMDAQESMMSEMRERQSQALQSAFADLEALRERVEAGDADTAQAVESIRQGLRESFTDSSDMDRSSWEETDLMLGELTDQLREGREEYRATYDGALTRLGETSQRMRDGMTQPGTGATTGTTTDDPASDEDADEEDGD